MHNERDSLPKEVLEPILSSMEKDRPYLENLVGDLIRCYPTYIEDGSGIKVAQSIVRRELTSLGFQVKEVHVQEDVMRNHSLYTRVKDWGSRFEHYSPEKNLTQLGILHIDDKAPTLALNGHVDVEPVFDPKTWKDPALWRSGSIVGDRIYGRGATDMLGGVAGLLFSLKHILNSPLAPQVNILFHSVADEEIGGNGTLKCLIDGPKADWALIAEPTGLTINQSSLGFHHFQAKSWGTPVHMSQASEGQSAIDVAVEIHNRLNGLRAKLKQVIVGVPGFEESNVNPLVTGRIAGGQDPAVPAETCNLEGVLFSSPQQTRQDIQNLLEETLASEPSLNASISLSNMSFDGAISSERTIPDALIQAGKFLNRPLSETGFPSPCDMRLYIATGTPTTIFGPGHLTEAHVPNEFLLRDELFVFSQVMAAFIAGLSKT
ncbi:M20/M25/M40 family metallo-hydrolase [Candidatus Parcubacteria bacterium]|nr:MAG: M20/M25/M40 family metallo-hydrolase [Candidatus Parcubacteria bacterium]